jgi:hypothetical protein
MQTKIAFPRLQFMFEGALEALATRAKTRICVGILSEEIIAFAALHHCTTICTTQIPSSELSHVFAKLEQAGLQLEIYPVQRLSNFKGKVKRFSAYWRSVEHEVLHD